jgi:Lipocalin-like domain
MKSLGIGLVLFGAVAAEGKSLRSQLDGEWRLVSSEQISADGRRGPSPLYGSGRVGYLVFAPSGGVCVILAAASSARPTSKESGDSLQAYCGRYQLNEAERYVVIDVKFDTVPNDVGEPLKRYISIEGKTLKLRTANPHPGIKEYTLTWHRL